MCTLLERVIMKSEKILIIEDDLNAARRIILLCRELGHDPLLARDGFTGMLLAKRLKPRLIISDLATPGLDGFEVVRRVRKDHDLDHTAIVGVTGNVPRSPAANQSNFDDFVLKPIDSEAMEQVISKFCATVAA
jgi:CheY-like chemotaxis protein